MTWLEIAEQLMAAVPWVAWPEAPWLPRLIVLDTEPLLEETIPGYEPRRVRAYRQAEAQCSAQVVQAVEQWLAGRELPEFEHPANYFLSLRFHTVSLHIRSWSPTLSRLTGNNPDSKEVAVLLRERLIDDWRDFGPNWSVGFSFVEHDFDEEGH